MAENRLRLSVIRKKEKTYAERTEDAEFAEKRDGNTEFTEVGTQRSRRKTEKSERVFTTEDTESTE